MEFLSHRYLPSTHERLVDDHSDGFSKAVVDATPLNVQRVFPVQIYFTIKFVLRFIYTTTESPCNARHKFFEDMLSPRSEIGESFLGNERKKGTLLDKENYTSRFSRW